MATQATDAEELESERLKARLGEMLLKQEALEARGAALEGGRPFGPQAVEAMSRSLSPSSGQPYGVVRVCRILGCGAGHPRRQPLPRRGNRKVWARLRIGGVHTSLRRVPRLMREHGLLALGRVGRPRGPRNHDGTIIPDRVDAVCGKDMTTTWTGEGQAAVFVAVDHHNAECVGLYAARRGTRFEALEPIRQGVRRCFGTFGPNVASGLAVRHDHGSQYMSDAFLDELRFLGIDSSPAFERAPEGNGAAERSIRTLEETLLWVQTFETVEEMRQAVLAFRDNNNTTWLIQRHGFQTPAAIRQQHLQPAAIAASAPDQCIINRRRYTRPYHPWTNGQAERMNRTLKDATMRRY